MIAKYLVFIFIFVVDISIADANLSTNICKDYLDPNLREKMTILDDSSKKLHIDINNDGEKEIVYLTYNGHVYDKREFHIELKNNQSYSYKEFIDEEDLIRFGLTKGILFYKNNYYIVHFYDYESMFPTYITYIDSDNIEHPLCKYKFKKSLHLTYHTKDYTPKQCNSFMKQVNEGKIIPFNIPSKFKFYYHQPNIAVGGIGYLDYNNDGKKEYLQSFEFLYPTQAYYGIYNDEHYLNPIFSRQKQVDANVWFEANQKIYSLRELQNGGKDINIIEKKNDERTVCGFTIEADSVSVEKIYHE